MKTIKLPYKTTDDLTLIFRQYSSVVRWAYNRFLECTEEKEVRHLTKTLNNIDLLNSWIVQCAIKDGQSLHKRFKDSKIIFGSKKNFIDRMKDKISKKELEIKRLIPINIQGEKLKKGNRSFNLDIIDNNEIIFKFNRNKHFRLELPNLRNNIKEDLFKLQQLNEEEGYTYSIRFDLKYLYISFEEFKKEEIRQHNKNRCLGIDMNPDTIGVSILENNEVIYAQEFRLSKIFDKIFDEKLSSDSDRMKYLQNKLKFETFEISKSIAKMAKKFDCYSVYIEDLSFKQNVDNKGNKVGNRKCRNLWKRETFVLNLTKRLNIDGIKLYKVNPAYSSFIGNLQYDYTDAINASIEIARRGYEYIIKNNKKGFYPSLDVKHRWKEMAMSFENWKDLFLEIKNSKLKYRVSLEDCKKSFRVFQQNSSHKSHVMTYVFYD